ncbi:MAG: DoxX family protein [Thermoguttaceae bacterium]|nr:DoxX family protein [Thermoguttaceae bacterium]MDW8036786.1 DoxX family protein [Thermoguttaceae bacterium]
MLVVLRLSLGCHFLYEGIWKIKNADRFSAKGFLLEAKGPLAPLFYRMVPDVDGRQRLQIEQREFEEDGKKVVRLVSACYLDSWQETLERFVGFYQMSDEQQAEAQKLLRQYLDVMDRLLRENRKDIEGYLRSLEDFEVRTAGASSARFEEARLWQEQRKLWAEAARWTGQLDQMGRQFHLALWNQLDDQQRAKGQVPLAAVGPDRLPFSLLGIQSWSALLDKMVTYSLTAIGGCLMLGLFTRLAALGGAVFMLMVLATQPPWPTIYPPFPEVVGHALVVDKNFIEMVALLVVMATGPGRWAGMDRFLFPFAGGLWSRPSTEQKHENLGPLTSQEHTPSTPPSSPSHSLPSPTKNQKDIS